MDDAETILNWNNDAMVQRLQLVRRLLVAKSIGTESGISTGTNISAGIPIANQLMDMQGLMLRKLLLFYQMVLPICITTTVVIQFITIIIKMDQKRLQIGSE